MEKQIEEDSMPLTIGAVVFQGIATEVAEETEWRRKP
jgi:hypothetical protein